MGLQAKLFRQELLVAWFQTPGYYVLGCTQSFWLPIPLNGKLTYIRKFFPHDPAAVKDEGKKEDETTSTSDEPKEPAALESTLPAVPKTVPSVEKALPEEPSVASPSAKEPDTKKQKSTHETAQDNDDDWEKIDKASIPRNATVEDAEDEEPKKF